MIMLQTEITVQTNGQGLTLITHLIEEKLLAQLPNPSHSGVLNIFLQHTSASLLIQENSDPTAREDLEDFLNRIAPEHQAWHRHLVEGPDDTVSHLKAAVLPTSLNIPIKNGKLAIGVWQGIYLWEHRRAPHA